MLKSFSEFINESTVSPGEFIKDLTLKLIQKIRSFREESAEYSIFSGMEFRTPFEFDLKLELRKDANFSVDQDQHFKDLPWEKLNYDKKGYAIDANTRINSHDLHIPEIIVTLVVNPSAEPHLYTQLHARLLDILTHETNHLDQLGSNRHPFNANPTTGKTRDDAKKNFKYFLLPDEIESMVEGMYANANFSKKPLDQMFSEYLEPFVQTGYITHEQYAQVLETWVKFALERYPDAIFSKKVEKIVNSI
jgi:hypothetical protein